MLEQVTTFEETEAFSCSVWMLRMTLMNSKAAFKFFIDVKKHEGIFFHRLTVNTVIISSKKLSKC